ncbi:hypothetical protein LCGC14_2557610 [marine sediment metagenome]|uniref:Uncharacterized protein n=1 Tax=marine sediment metagenome TaxID=412755 RepID=A0A0F9B911_9ZZZZ
MKKESKTIDLSTKVRDRKGEPFMDGTSPLRLGERLVFIIDGQAAGSVGDMRRVARLAEKLSDGEATGLVEVSEKEIDTLKTVLKGAANGMRFDLYCSLSHLIDPEEEEFASVAKWYEGGASKGTKAKEQLAKPSTPAN